MALVTNPYNSRLTLLLYAGDDERGNPIIRRKSFNGVKYDASHEDVYAVALALASLQTYDLVEAERTDRTGLMDDGTGV